MIYDLLYIPDLFMVDPKGTSKGIAKGKGQGHAATQPHMLPTFNCACIPYNDAWPHKSKLPTPASISHWMWTILPLKHTYVWQHVQTFHLTQNMLLGQNPKE